MSQVLRKGVLVECLIYSSGQPYTRRASCNPFYRQTSEMERLTPLTIE